MEVDVIRFSPQHLRVLDEANKTSVIINPHLQISSHLIRKFIKRPKPEIKLFLTFIHTTLNEASYITFERE